MSTNQLETQPVQEVFADSLNEQQEDAIPDVKSGVRVDPNAALQSARFFKGDLVHMSQIVNGQRVKGVYTVSVSQYNSRGGYIEYQLLDALTEKLYKNGAWVREKDLKIERRT
ncbi:hypothetical protein IQ07DRAFT_647864 [Pyrenochaeta sp. DS3sAY3a]|nr:hypothetical protein IQ07DRAFT_647864 [Pyrenochaeta sp. DS3sAY3a]